MSHASPASVQEAADHVYIILMDGTGACLIAARPQDALHREKHMAQLLYVDTGACASQLGRTPNNQERPTPSDLAENKREMFDGMRAYHQSEINHANHAITMLLAIAGAAGAAALAILFPQTPPTHITEIAWGLWITVAVFAFTIAVTAHIKINGDHATYANFGAEYVKTSRLLGFYDKILPTDGPEEKTGIKTNLDIGQGKGYRKTQIIIWAFAGVLVVLTFLFAVILTCSG